MNRRQQALIEWKKHRTIVIQYSEKELKRLRTGRKDRVFIVILSFPKLMYEKEVMDRIAKAFPEIKRVGRKRH